MNHLSPVSYQTEELQSLSTRADSAPSTNSYLNAGFGEQYVIPGQMRFLIVMCEGELVLNLPFPQERPPTRKQVLEFLRSAHPRLCDEPLEVTTSLWSNELSTTLTNPEHQLNVPIRYIHRTLPRAPKRKALPPLVGGEASDLLLPLLPGTLTNSSNASAPALPSDPSFPDSVKHREGFKCAITGAKLDVLGEAAHIIPRVKANLFSPGNVFYKPVVDTGTVPYSVDNFSNGWYIRVDLQRLFDRLAMGVNVERNVFKVWAFTWEAREFHGQELTFRPGQTEEHPSPLLFKWHFRKCLCARLGIWEESDDQGEESDDETDPEPFQESAISAISQVCLHGPIS